MENLVLGFTDGSLIRSVWSQFVCDICLDVHYFYLWGFSKLFVEHKCPMRGRHSRKCSQDLTVSHWITYLNVCLLSRYFILLRGHLSSSNHHNDGLCLCMNLFAENCHLNWNPLYLNFALFVFVLVHTTQPIRWSPEMRYNSFSTCHLNTDKRSRNRLLTYLEKNSSSILEYIRSWST
jgi:hypothetical protein